MQRRLAAILGTDAVGYRRSLAFRIGLHVGDLLVDGEQIFGDGINVAARLEALSGPGGVRASGAPAWAQEAATEPGAGPQAFRLLGAMLGRLRRTDEARAALD